MNYQEWCQCSKEILVEAEEYNKWRKRAQHNLLTIIAPKIGELGRTFYSGCGFHYALEQDLGKLIVYLSLPWQPCANHANKIEDAMSLNLVHQVIYDSLIDQIKEIDKTFLL